jgi:hypothetical protein
VCPRGGGKERKRLYEEGLTAGAVTAATVVAIEEGKGNFVGNKGLLLLLLLLLGIVTTGYGKGERRVFPVLDGRRYSRYLPSTTVSTPPSYQ